MTKAEHAALLKSAAKWWPKWTKAKHPNRSFWVADQVNGEGKTMNINGTRKPVQRKITAKWISRNRIAVELQANRRFRGKRN